MEKPDDRGRHMGGKRGYDRFKLRPPELHIALDGYDLSFTAAEVERIREAWGEGMSLEAMAAALDRLEPEVAVLVIDLAVNGKIQPRPGAMMGRERKS